MNMDKGNVYSIIPVKFVSLEDGAYLLKSHDGEQYKLTGGNIPIKKGSLIRLDKKTFLRLINDIVIDEDLEEIVIVNDATNIQNKLNLTALREKSTAVWSNSSTRILVNMYRELRPLVFGAVIKNLKQMWKLIAKNLQKHGFDYDIQQCERKWKSLKRSYRSGRILGHKQKSHYSAGPFEKDIGEILKMMKLLSSGKSPHAADLSDFSPTNSKKLKLSPCETKFDIENIKINEGKVTNEQIVKMNTGEINSNLTQIVKAIKAGSFKREKAEEKRQEQRERLIKAIEQRNKLLSQLLQKK